jgi:predicted RNA binding protein YcfA (HicA-like mRNA interferase family)
MKRLNPVSWKEYVARMKTLGFEGPYYGGNHPKMKRNNQTIIIPNKHDPEIGVGFLKRLLRQSGISEDEWLRD